ncbi:hypothetical protein Tco_0913483 [Tanacetum coccineum]
MQDLIDRVNDIEIKDICSSGMLYIWINFPKRAKIEWFKNGDRISKFFHKVIKSRRHGNRVTSICNEEGTKFKGDIVAEQFVKHFHNFLGIVDNVTPIVDDNGLFKNKLNDNEAIDMICDVTDAEIKNVVFDIDDAKAPRPNGFTSAFFKKSWRIIRKDICSAIKDFFKNGKLLREKGPKRCALKVDMAKASDTLSWEFLESILKQQGNPISPKLFTLVMRGVSLMVTRKVTLHLAFRYHKGNKELKLTHLYFADDLLVMSHGDHTSVFVIKGEKHRILEVLPFQTGRLLVKYLGISLLSKKIRVFDCKVLVDKVRNKVNDWKYKTLSYTEINKLMKSFLWSQGKGSKGKAKIAWYVNSLWVKWVNRVKLKGKSFWEANVKCNDSRTWKALLELRVNIRPHIFHDIDNVSSTSMWQDTWHSIGPLSSFVNSRSLYDARLSNSCNVIDMIKGNVWIWPEEWNSLCSTSWLSISKVVSSGLSSSVARFGKCITMDSVKPRVLEPGRYAIDVEPIPPRSRNNRKAHLDYLKHLKESVEALREIVEEAKTSINEMKSMRVNSCTDASGSQPRSNTKKNRISPAKSVNKKKVEEHPRINNSSLKTTNRVDSSIRSKRTVINSNSHSVYQTCNKCLISANHDLCVVNYLHSMNASPSVKNVMRKVKKVWKPKQVKQVWKATRKVLTNVGYQWKPTGRIFTLGDQCPVTRLTTSNVLPVQQTAHERIKSTKRSKNSQKPTKKRKSQVKSEDGKPMIKAGSV